MEYEVELKVGSQDDMLANAEKHLDKQLTLKSLEKEVRLKFIEIQKQIEIIKKSLKR